MKHLLSKLNIDELIAAARSVSTATSFHAGILAEINARGFASLKDAIKSQGVTRDGRAI